jgi:hypothetical protein
MADISDRLAALSGSARRLLDYVAALDGSARYAVLRHLARVTEEDMVEDLKECVAAGALAPVAGEPNAYTFADDAVRALVLTEAGEERLARLRARALAARQRVEGR